MEKLLVIGGSGFIGKHLCKFGVDNNLDVTSISRAKNPIINKVNAINVDIKNIGEVEEYIKTVDFDYVINTAGYINHDNFSKGGRKVIENHFAGLLNIIENINKKRLKKFINLGSSDEYGNSPGPQKEIMREDPISPYSFSKTASTHFLQMLWKTESVPCCIVRLFLVYGPGQKSNRFLPQIIRHCLDNKTFPLTSGTQFRDFCYVSDIVRGIFSCLYEETVNGEIINLGSGKPIQIKDVVEKVRSNIKHGSPKFGSLSMRKNENKFLVADISKAERLINWKPEICLDRGLENTINYYRNK